MTVAAASAALLPACNGSVDVEPTPATSCPDAQPAEGTACGAPLSCDYAGSYCGASFECVDSVWADRTPPCNPPPPDECPDLPPSTSTSCWTEGMTCVYPNWDECGQNLNTTCVGGTWEIEEVVSCNPPPPCPAEVPENGSSCDFPNECGYTVESECGLAPVNASCDGVTWTVDELICNPPAPDPCTTIGVLADCVADPTCRWLVPGCGAPALPQEGCFAKDDCSAGDCPLGEECQVASTQCDNCQTCDFPVLVCLPAQPEG